MSIKVSYTVPLSPIEYPEYKIFIDERWDYCFNNIGPVGDLWQFKFDNENDNKVYFIFQRQDDAILFKLRFK